jgi:hypothetical protein
MFKIKTKILFILCLFFFIQPSYASYCPTLAEKVVECETDVNFYTNYEYTKEVLNETDIKKQLAKKLYFCANKKENRDAKGKVSGICAILFIPIFIIFILSLHGITKIEEFISILVGFFFFPICFFAGIVYIIQIDSIPLKNEYNEIESQRYYRGPISVYNCVTKTEYSVWLKDYATKKEIQGHKKNCKYILKDPNVTSENNPDLREMKINRLAKRIGHIYDYMDCQ